MHLPPNARPTNGLTLTRGECQGTRGPAGSSQPSYTIPIPGGGGVGPVVAGASLEGQAGRSEREGGGVFLVPWLWAINIFKA